MSTTTQRKGRLTKVRSTHDNVRTDSMEGWFYFLPEVGLPFEILNESPLVQDAGYTHRGIFTSPIKALRWVGKNAFEFDTQNSTYKLEVL